MVQISKKDVCTVPNFISFFRIVLVFVFLYYYQADIEHKSVCLGIILILSGISDFLDGFIARRYNKITELGKCIDPVADKLMQLTLLLCLVTRYPVAEIVLGIFLIKEIVVAVMGYFVIRIQGKNEGAKWYGKVSTAVFFIVTILLVLFPQMKETWANILLTVTGICLLGAFVGYLHQFILVFRRNRSGGHDRTGI